MKAFDATKEAADLVNYYGSVKGAIAACVQYQETKFAQTFWKSPPGKGYRRKHDHTLAALRRM